MTTHCEEGLVFDYCEREIIYIHIDKVPIESLNIVKLFIYYCELSTLIDGLQCFQLF